MSLRPPLIASCLAVAAARNTVFLTPNLNMTLNKFQGEALSVVSVIKNSISKNNDDLVHHKTP